MANTPGGSKRNWRKQWQTPATLSEKFPKTFSQKKSLQIFSKQKKKFTGIPESQKSFTRVFAKKNFKIFSKQKKNSTGIPESQNFFLNNSISTHF